MRATIVGLALLAAGCAGPAHTAREDVPPVRRYVCYRAPAPVVVDGRLDDAAWQAAPWTEAFVDIEGDARPLPAWTTRAKMLWDSAYFYVAAELEEPDLWGTLVKRDTIIYHDNDFEVFIDPDGDTHAYYELEINVLGTEWDLFLEKPYRDGGPAVNAWDITGLASAMTVRGTVNAPGDRDTSWTVELAFPWAVLAEYAPEGRAPRDGEQWRVNFSRVQWDLDVADGGYRKRRDAATGEPLPEHNWVWSPQGAINMHMPEMWGVVQFSDVAAGAGTVEARAPDGERYRWYLRRLYYAQGAYREAQRAYAGDLAVLDLGAVPDGDATITVTEAGYEAVLDAGADGVWHIREDGRVWREVP